MFINIFKGVLVGLAASVTVGPVAILCAQRALSRSRMSAFVSGLGVVCGDTFMATIAYFLYYIIFSHIEQYKSILGVIGGIVVIIFGTYIVRKNPVNDFKKSQTGKSSLGQDFLSVLGLTLSNFIVAMPYIFAFFALFNVGMSNDASSISMNELAKGIFTLTGFLIGSFCWWTGLTMSLGTLRNKVKLRHFVWINRITGSVIIILGIYTILATFLEII